MIDLAEIYYLKMFLKILCIWLFCLLACLCTKCMQCLQMPEEGTRSTLGPELKMVLRAATLMWKLNPGSSGGTVSSLKCWVINPSPTLLCLIIQSINQSINSYLFIHLSSVCLFEKGFQYVGLASLELIM